MSQPTTQDLVKPSNFCYAGFDQSGAIRPVYFVVNDKQKSILWHSPIPRHDAESYLALSKDLPSSSASVKFSWGAVSGLQPGAVLTHLDLRTPLRDQVSGGREGTNISWISKATPPVLYSATGMCPAPEVITQIGESGYCATLLSHCEMSDQETAEFGEGRG